MAILCDGDIVLEAHETAEVRRLVECDDLTAMQAVAFLLFRGLVVEHEGQRVRVTRRAPGAFAFTHLAP